MTDTCVTVICCYQYLCDQYLFASYECSLSINAVSITNQLVSVPYIKTHTAVHCPLYNTLINLLYFNPTLVVLVPPKSCVVLKFCTCIPVLLPS